MPVTQVGAKDIPLTELTRFPGNARRGNVDQIRTSVRRLGQYRTIVVRQHDGQFTILAGNHTAEALAAEGHETARCEIIECTDSDAVRINVADNRMADLGDYDDRLLAELLAQLDGDYEGTGYDPQDVDKLADSLSDPEPPDDFKDYDDDIDTEYCCPKCGYEWSGKPS